jgi:hypothetical protein
MVGFPSIGLTAAESTIVSLGLIGTLPGDDVDDDDEK